MARETKVGLLVGLAFIVCFAVILANRGRQDQMAAQLPHSLFVQQTPQDGQPPSELRSGPALTVRSAPETESRRAATYRPTTYVRGNVQDRGRGVVEQREPVVLGKPDTAEWRRTMARGSGSRRLGTPKSAGLSDVRSDEASTGVPAGLSITPALSRNEDDQAGRSSPEGNVQLVSSTSDMSEQTRALQDLLDRAANRVSGVSRDGEPVRTQRAVSDQSDARPSKVSKPILRTGLREGRYVVVSGDSLSKIALEAYGTRTREVLEAVFHANRSVMSDINKLAVGDELVLPLIPGVEGPVRSGRRSSDAGSHRAREANKPEAVSEQFRWYQVENNDRYTSIARDQLGEVGRWKEIYELNKDKFPDPDRIRPGVRIKLPSR